LWWSGAFGLVFGLLDLILRVLGLSQSATLWVRSILLVLGAVAVILNHIYKTARARDQEEKIQAALYEALQHNRPGKAGSDVSSRSTSKE
jgi:hypothetical protein